MSHPLSLQERRELAALRVNRFVSRFEPGYLELVYHAALPLVLTPELLSYLRNEFLRHLPWVAEVDLLLSDLCSPIGHERYAMDPDVRDYAISQQTPTFTPDRQRQVAKLLITYIRYLAGHRSQYSDRELATQQWAAMLYLGVSERQQVVDQITDGFRGVETAGAMVGGELLDRAELARLAQITQTFQAQLTDYPGLLDYARLVNEVQMGRDGIARERVEQSYPVAPGKVLRLPSSLRTELVARGRLPGPAQAEARDLIKVLFLAANPKNTSHLQLDQEVRTIKEDLIQGRQGDRFVLAQQWVTRPRDVHRAILDQNPQIIHFLGYGGGEDGLVLEDDQGQPQLVPTAALAGLFELFADQVQCVLFNACYSALQGQAIAQHIPYVIGMKQAIGDTAAREFVVRFYDALAAGRDIEFAYRFACSGMQMVGLPENLPVLLKRENPTEISQVKSSNPDLQTLTFQTARFIEPNAPSPDPTPPALEPEPFSFTIATLERQPGPRQKQSQNWWGRLRQSAQPTGNWVIQRQPGQAYRYVETLLDQSRLELVAIPGGSFTMGSPKNEPDHQNNESPLHEVTLTPFFMGRYPITQAQWRAVASLPQVKLKLDPDPSHFKGDSCPVERVNWFDAMEFCARLSVYTGQTYTLPSEAQWEYACRAGTTTPFYFGETITPDLANYDGNYTYADGPKGDYRQETTPVDHFPYANAWGLSDMHGNVREWCLDHYHNSYEGAPRDGTAWIDAEAAKNKSRILRGGSWYFYPRNCRCAFRFGDIPVNRIYSFGFRVVSVPPRALG